jgi:hypothetical protein
MRTIAILAAVLLTTACITNKTTYTVDESGNPVISVERENFMRVGQSVQITEYDGEKVTVTQLSWADAMSDQLTEAWESLNKTARYAIIGAGVGAVAGSPGLGALLGAGGSQVEDAVRGEEIVEEAVEGVVE